MSELPGDLEYTDEHEWLRREDDGSVTVGITDHAQAALGDLVYVELPEVDQDLETGGEMAVVESVKSASDIYAPVAGEIVEVNEELADNPSLVNESPFDNGWLFKLKVADTADIDALLAPNAYKEKIS